MAIESPVDVLRRLRETAKQQRLARTQKAESEILDARTGSEKSQRVGSMFGEALFNKFNAPDHEQDPAVLQAKARQKLLDVDVGDANALKQRAAIAAKIGDYEVSSYLTNLYYKARGADTADVKAAASGKKPKEWRYKNFTGEDRKLYSSQVGNAFSDANLEDTQAEPASDAVIAAAENLWNLRRERGDKEFTKAEAVQMASKFAKNYVVDDWGYNSFDSARFTSDFAETVGRYRGAISGQPAPKRQGIPNGTRKGDYIFTGTEEDNPNDKKLWKKVTPKATKKEAKEDRSGFVDVPMRSPFDTLNKLIKKKIAPVDVDDDDDFDI